MFNFAKKLKIIKHEVKGWSKTHFGNFHDKLSRNTQKIEYVEDKLLGDSLSHFTCLFHLILARIIT